MKLMVIDGNSIVNRAFYGVSQTLTTREGLPTNAIFGFLNILLKLLDEEQPEGLAVAFDLRAPTFRHKAFADYKAQRKGMPEELAVQMPVLKEVLDAMNIRRCELEGWEADDLLGTMARINAAQGGDTAHRRAHHRQAGHNPHGPDHHPERHPGGFSQRIRLRPHPHDRPEGVDGGLIGQLPRREGGG